MDSEPSEAARALIRRRWDALSPEERRAATRPAREALAEKRRQQEETSDE